MGKVRKKCTVSFIIFRTERAKTMNSWTKARPIAAFTESNQTNGTLMRWAVTRLVKEVIINNKNSRKPFILRFRLRLVESRLQKTFIQNY